jgi:hypothetical protein
MNDPHARFSAWLTAGAHGEPPRDLALHASVCPECTGAIAAMDLLSQIDPGRAKMPFWEGPDEEPGGLIRAARFAAAAAGVMLVAVVVGIGATQLIVGVRGSDGVALSSETPQQGVLGGGGSPAASPDAGSAPASTATPTASPSDEPGTQFTITTALPTPRPTVAPTRTPRPTPTPTVTPSSTPTPTDTPSPTPSPSPASTVPYAIGDLVAAPGVTSGTIDLSWSAPGNGGSPILSYNVYRGTISGGETFLLSTSGTSFVDSAPNAGTNYYYITAVNSVGEGAPSNEAFSDPSP